MGDLDRDVFGTQRKKGRPDLRYAAMIVCLLNPVRKQKNKDTCYSLWAMISIFISILHTQWPRELIPNSAGGAIHSTHLVKCCQKKTFRNSVNSNTSKHKMNGVRSVAPTPSGKSKNEIYNNPIIIAVLVENRILVLRKTSA